MLRIVGRGVLLCCGERDFVTLWREGFGYAVGREVLLRCGKTALLRCGVRGLLRCGERSFVMLWGLGEGFCYAVGRGVLLRCVERGLRYDIRYEEKGFVRVESGFVIVVQPSVLSSDAMRYVIESWL